MPVVVSGKHYPMRWQNKMRFWYCMAAMKASLNNCMSLPYPDRHQIIVADLTHTADRAMLLQHPALNAGIDVLINNAGTNEFAWLEDQDRNPGLSASYM